MALRVGSAVVKIIATSPDMIDVAEDRERFQAMLQKPASASRPTELRPTSRSADVARRIGYPVLVRPSTCWAGRAMEICDDEDVAGPLHERGGRGLARPPRPDRQVPRRPPSKSTSTRFPTAKRRLSAADGAHRRGRRPFGRLGLLAPPYSLPSEVVDEIKQATYALARELASAV